MQRRVLIELGVRSDHSPAGDYSIRPYAADEFPDSFEDSVTTVHTLEARRTFWEKATLLHWLYHRENPSEKYVLRNSRHYYDLAMMAQSPVRDHAVGETVLLSGSCNTRAFTSRQLGRATTRPRRVLYTWCPMMSCQGSSRQTTSECRRCSSPIHQPLMRSAKFSKISRTRSTVSSPRSSVRRADGQADRKETVEDAPLGS